MEGIIFEYNNKWFIEARHDSIPIHPDYLPTILDGDKLKPAYQGKVEYVETKVKVSKLVDHDHILGFETELKSYAIPIHKVSEDKGDVWEEAVKSLCYKHFDCEYETAHRFICDLRKIKTH